MTDPSPLYLSYLMRLWLAGDDDQPQWRLSLEDTHSGERVGFASLEELVEFLKEKIGENGIKPSV